MCFLGTPPKGNPFIPRFLVNLGELGIHAETIGAPRHGNIYAEFFLAVSLADEDLSYQCLSGGEHGIRHQILTVNYLKPALLNHLFYFYPELGVSLFYHLQRENLLPDELILVALLHQLHSLFENTFIQVKVIFFGKGPGYIIVSMGDKVYLLHLSLPLIRFTRGLYYI